MQNPYALNVKSSGPSLMMVNKFQDLEVFNHLNQPIGKIQDYILNILDLSIDYVIMSFDAMSGIKDKVFVVPWQALILDEDTKRFILPFDKKQLGSAPGFSADCADSPGQSLLMQVDEFYESL